MKSFSLSTLLLLVTVVSLGLAQLVTWRKLQALRLETELVRRKFGHIRVVDERKTYVSRFINDDYQFDGQTAESFRIHVPDGVRYVLHISDWPGDRWPNTDELVPTLTKRLEPRGSDVVVSCVELYQGKGQTPRIVVVTERGKMFDHVPVAWSGGWNSESSSWPDVDPSVDQTEFEPSEVIRLYRWSTVNKERDGFVLWLEPHERWESRNGVESSDQKHDSQSESSPNE